MSISTESNLSGNYNLNGTYTITDKDIITLEMIDDIGVPVKFNCEIKSFSKNKVVLEFTDGVTYLLKPE